MRFTLPTQTKHNAQWEGGDVPPLRLRGEKPSAILRPPSIPSHPAAPQSVERLSRLAWIKRHLVVALCVAACSLPAYLMASRFVVTAVVIQGRSMTPTLKDGERYFLNRWCYLLRAPSRGEVVVIKDPGHSDFAVKRIVARPLDWVNFKNGAVYINGKRLDEPYLEQGTRTDSPDSKERWIQLGPNQYYLLGDNRANSEDSRFYGVVQGENIVGKIVN